MTITANRAKSPVARHEPAQPHRARAEPDTVLHLAHRPDISPLTPAARTAADVAAALRSGTLGGPQGGLGAGREYSVQVAAGFAGALLRADHAA
ncbi:hypothetical protein BX265_7570 [Streptomyces sp. TLI_235]|nr:hypothetical protein [Streptomyces sp. TLI_235]PBC70175.1 hypothetical protein BX265_7570 [Streptomyces sp. TLI_235]